MRTRVADALSHEPHGGRDRVDRDTEVVRVTVMERFGPSAHGLPHDAPSTPATVAVTPRATATDTAASPARRSDDAADWDSDAIVAPATAYVGLLGLGAVGGALTGTVAAGAVGWSGTLLVVAALVGFDVGVLVGAGAGGLLARRARGVASDRAPR